MILLSSWGWIQNLSLLFWMSCRVNGKFRSLCTQLGFALWWQKWVYRVRAGEWRIIESNILVQLQLLTTLTSKPGPSHQHGQLVDPGCRFVVFCPLLKLYLAIISHQWTGYVMFMYNCTHRHHCCDLIWLIRNITDSPKPSFKHVSLLIEDRILLHLQIFQNFRKISLTALNQGGTLKQRFLTWNVKETLML